MIDWGARIDDLTDVLQRQVAIHDRMVVEVLLSAMLKVPRTRAAWVILETNWYDGACRDAWFSFGRLWMPESLLRLRRRAPSLRVDEEIDGWLANPDEQRLFIEPDFERYPVNSMISHGHFLLQRCSRIRTRLLHTPSLLRELDENEALRRQAELAACARKILEDPFHARPAEPPKFIEPPDFLYCCELVHKLAPWFPDWRLCVLNLGALAIRHAYLYGRTETGQEERDMLARLMHDMVPSWVRRMLETLMIEETARFSKLEDAMQLRQKAHSGYGAHAELRRMRRTGIIDILRRQRVGGLWYITEKHRRGVELLLEGRLFNAPLASACA